MKKPLAEWHSTGGKEKGIALVDDNTAGAERQGKMHSKGTILFSRMTKSTRRRYIVRFVELCFWMVVMSVGCVVTALAISACLRALGVG